MAGAQPLWGKLVLWAKCLSSFQPVEYGTGAQRLLKRQEGREKRLQRTKMQNQPEKREKACSPLNDYLQRCREAQETTQNPRSSRGAGFTLRPKGEREGGSLEPKGESFMKRAVLEEL